nr:hypothetical protein CFP56_17059 [Quercus suber]
MYCVEGQWFEDRKEGEVVIPMIAFIEGGMRVLMGTMTRYYLRAHRQGYYLKSRYLEVRLIQCLPESNKGLKKDFWILLGEWHDGLPCPTREGKPDPQAAMPHFHLVNREGLDKILKAEPIQPEFAGLKKKRDAKGKEVMDAGKSQLAQEEEAQRIAKQSKVGQRGVEKRSGPPTPPVWILASMLDGEPLLANASIHDYQGGKASYVANVVEQGLLFPNDMGHGRVKELEEARGCSIRVEEVASPCHKQMKEEEARHNVAVEASRVADKTIKDLRDKLLEEERERKSATAALEGAKRQVENQRVLLHNAEDQLAATKAQITSLKKKLEEMGKAKDDVERAREEAERARE